MDTIPGLTETNARKRALPIESDLNRQILRVEFGRIHLQTERPKHGWAHTAWKWALPVAGFLLARRFKQTSGLFAKGSFVMTALGALWKVWQSFRAKPAASPASR